MAHFPKPFYKKSRGAWYVEIDRKQIKLGVDRDKAFERYHHLMTQPKERAVSPELLACVVDVFLDWVQKNRTVDTYEWYRYRLQRLVDRYPDMQAADLRPYHIEQWVDSYPKLKVTTRRNYMCTIKRCMSWALRQGYIDHNPIEALDIPGAERRDVYIPPDEFARLLEYAADPGFRNLLKVTYLSGCRPQESLIVQAKHVDLEHCRWIFPQNQSKGKRAPRIVYLTEPAMEIVKGLVRLYPEGTLFRNSNGRTWTTEAVNCVFSRIQTCMGKKALADPKHCIPEAEIGEKIKSLKSTTICKGLERRKTLAELRCEAKRKLLSEKCRSLVPRYSLYALRHSWATNALKSGVDPLTVAILMGHKDPSMLARVYQHLSHSPDHMLDQAKRAAGNNSFELMPKAIVCPS